MYQLRKIGDLDVIEIPAEKNCPVVVLLHGYGADAQDLANLSHVLKMPPGTGWLVPNGPLRIPVGPHFEGRAWAPINMEEWQRAMMEGRPRDLSNDNPPEMQTSQKMIMDLLKTLGISPGKVIFAGFSQGAMLATQLALMSPESPLGLVIFSGSLLNAAAWEKAMTQRKGFKYFQSHGIQDAVLSIGGAEKLHSLFEKHNLEGYFIKFEGGHEIPSLALAAAQKYIASLFPDKELWEEKH